MGDCCVFYTLSVGGKDVSRNMDVPIKTQGRIFQSHLEADLTDMADTADKWVLGTLSTATHDREETGPPQESVVPTQPIGTLN